MYPQIDAAVEDAVFTGYRYLMNINAHLRGDDLRDLIEHTHAVDTADADGGIEEQHFVHVPLDIEDAVAVARLQFGSYRTDALVDLDLILVVDIAQGVIARDRVTTSWELILVDILF